MWHILFVLSFVHGQYRINPSIEHSIHKRDAGLGGTLNIQTNHAQPIHADVKPELTDVSEKPCPKTGNVPSEIEPGTVFKVTAPRDAIYEVKSLRKSLPLTDTLDLIRSVSRVVTLTVLLVSAILEFFPLIQHLYGMISMYLNS